MEIQKKHDESYKGNYDLETFVNEIVKSNFDNLGIRVNEEKYTVKEARFALRLAEGFSPVKAFKDAGYSDNYTTKKLAQKAYQQSKKTKIGKLVKELKQL